MAAQSAWIAQGGISEMTALPRIAMASLGPALRWRMAGLVRRGTTTSCMGLHPQADSVVLHREGKYM